jgi:TPP-dependent pyruvate/acetoin dehydrogenase alpha subunit
MFDPELYRSKEEVESWKRRGPILTFIDRLRSLDLLTQGDLDAIEADVASEIEDAIAYAEAGHWEPVEELTNNVYAPAEVGP